MFFDFSITPYECVVQWVGIMSDGGGDEPDDRTVCQKSPF
jgi:hypothetical protein